MAIKSSLKLSKGEKENDDSATSARHMTIKYADGTQHECGLNYSFKETAIVWFKVAYAYLQHNRLGNPVGVVEVILA